MMIHPKLVMFHSYVKSQAALKTPYLGLISHFRHAQAGKFHHKELISWGALRGSTAGAALRGHFPPKNRGPIGIWDANFHSGASSCNQWDMSLVTGIDPSGITRPRCPFTMKVLEPLGCRSLGTHQGQEIYRMKHISSPSTNL